MKIPRITLALAAISLLSSPAAVMAGELEELKAMLLKMQERIAALEAKQNATPATSPAAAAPTPSHGGAVPAPAKPVLAGDLPGSIKIPGTDTSLQIYGYAQLDATHDFKGRPSDFNNNGHASVIFVQPLDTTADGRIRTGQTFMTARTSRLGVATSTPTSQGVFTTKLEGDFDAPNQFGGEIGHNGSGFRVRHAYGEMGNWLIGQTWSNFLDLRSYPDMVDFNPPGSVALLRQPQVRYSFRSGDAYGSVAVENSQSLTFANDFDRSLDITARVGQGGGWGHISAQAATLEYRNELHHRRGYALGVSGSFIINGDTLAWSVQGGDGIGRYMFNSILQGAVETGTAIRTWQATGWTLGYTHVWNPSVRSNLVLSQTRFGADAAANIAQRAMGVSDIFPNRKIDQFAVNVLWGVAKNIEAGLEYAYGQRRTFKDEAGTQSRVNSTVRYSFP